MSNSKWVCFDCRSTYNREHRECPTCGGDVQYIGKYFKPPRKRDDTEWQAIKMLHDAGIRYDHGAVQFHSSQIDAYLNSTRPMSQRDLLNVMHNAAFYYRCYVYKYMAGERPRHPREAQHYLETIESRKQDMLNVMNSIADKLGRDHPEIQKILTEIADIQRTQK